MKNRPPAASPASPAILDVSNLRIERGQTVILDNISWRVARGEHWVILGPNGCGKTSLLHALTGCISPTGGGVAVLGRAYGECDWRDLRLQIGIVTNALQASIPPAETALDTVISGKYAQLDLWKKTTRADKAGALKLLRFIDAAHLARREWVYLSQGERQRVLIARALMARPRLLILDEPCSGLDPVAREHFLAFIEKLARARRAASPARRRANPATPAAPATPDTPALVLVTHHVEEITPAFTHALILREGKTLAQGALAATLTTRTLARAFGAPMRLVRKAGRCELRFRQGARSGKLAFWDL